jgi:hypothetical protein
LLIVAADVSFFTLLIPCIEKFIIVELRFDFLAAFGDRA